MAESQLCYRRENYGTDATWTPSKQAVADIHEVTGEACMGVVPDPAMVNADDAFFFATSLSVAAAKGNAGVVDVLLKAGVDVDTVAVYGESPLLMAAKEGHKDIVEKLLMAGADIDNASTHIGTTPLIEAVLRGNTTIVEQLLESGADVNKERKNDGSTPILLASLKGLEDVVNQLIWAGADLNKASTHDGTTPLVMASGKGNARLVETLLRCGADPNKATTTDDKLNALSIWALNGNERVVELLVKAGARIVTEIGESALTLAAGEGHTGVCSVLLKAGADVNHESEITWETPLNVAVRHDHRETALSLFTQHGASSSAGIVDEPTRQKLAQWVVQEMMENAEIIETRKHQRAELQRRRATMPNLLHRKDFFSCIS